MKNSLPQAKGPFYKQPSSRESWRQKKTGDLIPLCHPIGLDHCQVTIQTNDKDELIIRCQAEVTAKTGIEMEALVGASLAALTIYDMCKAMSHHICIRETRLLSKTGGKKDFTYEFD